MPRGLPWEGRAMVPTVIAAELTSHFWNSPERKKWGYSVCLIGLYCELSWPNGSELGHKGEGSSVRHTYLESRGLVSPEVQSLYAWISKTLLLCFPFPTIKERKSKNGDLYSIPGSRWTWDSSFFSAAVIFDCHGVGVERFTLSFFLSPKCLRSEVLVLKLAISKCQIHHFNRFYSIDAHCVPITY